jgi:hypothetical protein
MKSEEMKQLKLNDDGTISEEAIEEIKPEPVNYNRLDKVDLIRLCKERDEAIKSYESERKSSKEEYDKSFSEMAKYYVAQIKELQAALGYYQRKFNMIKQLIDLEKEEQNNDTVQRASKREA